MIYKVLQTLAPTISSDSLPTPLFSHEWAPMLAFFSSGRCETLPYLRAFKHTVPSLGSDLAWLLTLQILAQIHSLRKAFSAPFLHDFFFIALTTIEIMCMCVCDHMHISRVYVITCIYALMYNVYNICI